MKTNVLEYLEESAARVPEKIAFADDNKEMNFKELLQRSQAVGSALIAAGAVKEPVAVFMEKGPDNIAAFFGAVYAGGSYVPIDEEMPKRRIGLIFEKLQPKVVICDEKTAPLAEEYGLDAQLMLYSDLASADVNSDALGEIRRRHCDTDPVYIIFTSGSTGTPKGVVAGHRSLIDYIESLSDVLELDETAVFGNQAPLYFDASMKELYETIKHGATTYMIPKSLFMFPIKLLEYLNEHKINTLCWVVSAQNIVSTFNAFEKIIPEYVRTITFVGEVFPVKQLNIWRKALPEARFFNVYGPTEITGVCTAFEVKREYAPDEVIPVGKPLKNCEILLLNDKDEPAGPGETGEICVRGTCLALGYYADPEKTAAAFVQNPLNDKYPEKIYRTGDLGQYDENGDLVFRSRKDFQIKHMGHRIELGEIEAAVHAKDGIQRACCLFDDVKKKILLFYVGDAEKAEMVNYIKDSLPRYMVPNYVEKLDEMPLTANGKIDRVLLKARYDSRQK